MHILINKVFDMAAPKYNDDGVRIEEPEYEVAPIIVQSQDIVRIYTEMPDKKKLVYKIYDRSHDRYYHEEEIFESEQATMRRLREIYNTLNEDVKCKICTLK